MRRKACCLTRNPERVPNLPRRATAAEPRLPHAIRAIVVLACLLAAAATAQAQPMGMPPASAIGKPLVDTGMPAGMVSVRVARTMPRNPVVDVEVSAIIRNAGGDLRRRTQKTDASGRAMFEGMVPGDQFHAEVTVDGEKLTTDTFTIPAQGGIKTMLIAALGKGGGAPAGGGTSDEAGAGGDAQTFTLGATAGAAYPDEKLPAKTLEVHLYDEGGAPIPNHSVLLGMVDKSNKVDVRRGTSDAAGVVRFEGLATGEGTGYAAITEWKGMRLGTAPFAMPDPAQGGARGEIRALARTSDPSVMTVGPGARVVAQMREDTLQFLEMLPLENTSDKMFDPGAGALEIPLPTEFTGAQAQEADRPVEVRQGHGVAVRGAFTPKHAIAGTSAKAAGQEVAFGFVLPYHGETREFVQPMPNGMGPFTLITEQPSPGRPVDITVTGPGVGARESRELGGKKYWVMAGTAIPAGGELRFTLHGLPATDATGRIVAGVLALLLIAGAVVLARRPAASADGKGRPDADERVRLTNLREALFTELVTAERARRTEGAVGESSPERKQLVTKLERVYRDLAALDERQAG
jgi:hypothetical protein